MAERLTPVAELSKLIDACYCCSVLLRAADNPLWDGTFREFYGRLLETLDQFAFELQRENSRLGSREPRPLPSFELRLDTSESLLARAEDALQSAVEGYDACLMRPMTPHARAMVQRQRLNLAHLLVDLAEMSRVETVTNH